MPRFLTKNGLRGIAAVGFLAAAVCAVPAAPPRSSSPTAKRKAVVILIHGSGLWPGKNWPPIVAWCRALERDGFRAMSVAYPIAPRYHWPAQVDAVTLIAKRVAAKAGRAPYLVGFSFGGTIAEAVACRIPIAGVVAIGSPQDFETIRKPWVETILGSYNRRAASPLYNHSFSRSMPVLLIHGADDGIVPARQSVAMARSLRADGHTAVTLYVVPDAGHPGVPPGILGRAYPRMLQWLRAEEAKAKPPTTPPRAKRVPPARPAVPKAR
jgi:acetyl esterase/lipase